MEGLSGVWFPETLKYLSQWQALVSKLVSLAWPVVAGPARCFFALAALSASNRPPYLSPPHLPVLTSPVMGPWSWFIVSREVRPCFEGPDLLSDFKKIREVITH